MRLVEFAEVKPELPGLQGEVKRQSAYHGRIRLFNVQNAARVDRQDEHAVEIRVECGVQHQFGLPQGKGGLPGRRGLAIVGIGPEQLSDSGDVGVGDAGECFYSRKAEKKQQIFSVFSHDDLRSFK